MIKLSEIRQGGSIGEMVARAEALIRVIYKRNLLPEDKRNLRGGAFSFFCPDDDWVPVWPIGTITIVGETTAAQRAASCIINAVEKPRRLSQHPEHDTSWQSRNEEAQQWGGAIRVRTEDGYLILAFSNFPECWDEAFVLTLAIRMGWMALDHARKIAHETTLPCLEALLVASAT